MEKGLRAQLAEATALLERLHLRGYSFKLVVDTEAFLASRAPAQPAAPYSCAHQAPACDLCKAQPAATVCHDTSKHTCSFQPAAPEPSADMSERAHAEMWMRQCAAAEAQLAAVKARVTSLADWLNAAGRYVSAKRAAELVAALLTPAPSPGAGEGTER